MIVEEGLYLYGAGLDGGELAVGEREEFAASVQTHTAITVGAFSYRTSPLTETAAHPPIWKFLVELRLMHLL